MEGDSAMAGAAENRRRHPRDLLRRFGNISNCNEESVEANGADSDEIELSLGLSLGGCFGSELNSNSNSNSNANAKGKSKLLRASSIASISPFAGDDEFAATAAAASSLGRTCSLPTETVEERRKRKEMESLKRLEAKRKRLDRRNSIKSGGSGRERAEEKPLEEVDGPRNAAAEIGSDGWRGVFAAAGGRFSGSVNGIAASPPPEWAVGGVAPRAADGGFPPISQGSIGSQGSSSFCAADFEIKAGEGNDSNLKLQPLPDNTNHKIAAIPPQTAAISITTSSNIGQQNPIRTLSGSTNSVGKNIMEDMPCVSTKGDGPNGRRIEGFLFKFEKVEDLRIVCVCHGNFLTPAEFVKHAGGGDVAHPLRHIVVNPSPSNLS